MIYLSNTQSSTVTVTLYENCKNIYNPYFLWQITDKSSFNSILFTADDHSYSPYYFNQFTFSVVSITGTTTPYGSTNGTIYTNTGTYDYKVYEMANQYDLDIKNAVGLVEEGILTIAGSYSSYLVNTQNDDATIFVNTNLDFSSE